MRRGLMTLVFGISAAAAATTGSADTQDVLPGDPDWFGCCGDISLISGTNPRSGIGSLEVANHGAWIGFTGTPYGTYDDLEFVSFEWYIDSYTSPPGPDIALPPELALRFYNYGDPATFFLHWDTCSPAVACTSRPVGSWQTTTLTRAQLSLQDAEGRPPPDPIPSDAPVMEIHLRSSYSFGGPWHGFIDNVTVGFAGQDPLTYNFEIIPEPQTWTLMALGLLLVGTLTRKQPTRHGAELSGRQTRARRASRLHHVVG